MNTFSLVYLCIYTYIGRMCIRGEITMNTLQIYATKPLLMPILIQSIRCSLLQIKKKNRNSIYLLFLALHMAWLGDIFLLPSSVDNKDPTEIGFILGLLSFLIMQLIYIHMFNSIEGLGIVETNKLLILPYLVLYVVVNYLINPYVKELFIPVLVYSACLIYMAICSLNLIGKIQASNAITITIGSIVFAISDAFIAFQKFNLIQSNTLTQGIIMFTYIIDQLFIILGFTLSKLRN